MTNLKDLIKEVEELKLNKSKYVFNKDRLYAMRQTVEAVNGLRILGSPDWQKLKKLLELK